MREAPALEASRTRERARARLAALSAPMEGEGSEREEVVMRMDVKAGRTCLLRAVRERASKVS